MSKRKKNKSNLTKPRGPMWVGLFSRFTKTKREKEAQEQRKAKQNQYRGEE